MVNDTYNNLRRAITEVEASLGALKSLLNMPTDPASLDTAGAPAEEQAEAPGDQFSTPALSVHAPEAVPTITPVDEAEVPADVKAADQGA